MHIVTKTPKCLMHFFLCIKTYLTTEEPERLNQNQKNFTNYLLTFFLLAGTSLKTAKSFYYDERYYSFIRTEATKIQDPPDLVVSVPQIPQVGIFAQAGPSGMSRRPVQKSDNQSTDTKKVDQMTVSDAETRMGSDSDVSSPPQSPTETGGSSAPRMEIPKVDPSTVAGPSEQPASLKKGMASELAENRFISAAHGEAAAVENTPAAVQSQLAVNETTEYAGSSQPLSRFNSGGSDYSTPNSEDMRLITETIEEHNAMFGSGELPAPIRDEVSPNKETEIAYEGHLIIDQEKEPGDQAAEEKQDKE